LNRHEGATHFAMLRLLLTVSVCVGLAACGRPTGDFGRPDRHGFALPIPANHPLAFETPSHPAPPPLTEPERELRARAWEFLRPIENGTRHGARIANHRAFTLGEARQPRDPTAYYHRIR